MRNSSTGFLHFQPFSLLVLFVTIASGVVNAEDPDYGKLRAAIRSADYPCAHVQEVSNAGNNAWDVQCNSGHFRVARDGDGAFSVSKKTPAE